MKMKLIGEVKRGEVFHYHDSDRLYVKDRKGYAIAPSGRIVRVSETTLVHGVEYKAEEELK
jgi:hypothetical protein